MANKHKSVAMSVITASTFNAKLLTTSELKKGDYSSQVYLGYNGAKLRVQTPQMSIPYDAGDFNGNQKYKVNLSFKGASQNPKLQKFQEMVQTIDNYVIDVAVANAGKWFKMPAASRELVSAFFTPSLKISKDKDGNPKDYPPTVMPKLDFRNGSFSAELYDDKNAMMEGVTPLDVLRRGSEVVAILDVANVWVGDKKFGVTWRLHQACVKVPGEGSSARGFLGVDEDAPVVSARDEADLMAAVMPSKAAAVEEDEEEDEEEEEEEVVPAPPVPAKKVAAAAGAKKVVKKVGGK